MWGTHISSALLAMLLIAGVRASPSLYPVHYLRPSCSADVSRTVHGLGARPGGARAEPNTGAAASTTVLDPGYSEQRGLSQIQASAAWDVITGTEEVIVAVVDAGLDTSHPDLAAQLWVNPDEIRGNGLDDDKNGYVDDIYGWNMVAGNADLSDNTGHGTFMAGIIGAAKNGEGIVGVCWTCRLMVVKVTGPDGLACYSHIVEGVAYAAQNGADVINISLRGRLDLDALETVITEASQAAVVVSGAGNDHSSARVYPAAYDGVLAVAGTNGDDTKLDESNYGAWVDVAAPGKDIWTTSGRGGYQLKSGTSVAAAFASGLAGLLQSQHPDWSPDLVRLQIMHTADRIDGLNPGYEGQLGAGRINAARAATTAAQPLLSTQAEARQGVGRCEKSVGYIKRQRARCNCPC